MARLKIKNNTAPAIDADNQTIFVKVGRTPAGARGKQGADGKSTYDLAVENGYMGTLEQWLDEMHTGVSIQNLISSDPNNNLQLGSDKKLLSQPSDIDFLADYILASN